MKRPAHPLHPLLLALLLALLWGAAATYASTLSADVAPVQGSIEIEDLGVAIEFPEKIKFGARFTGSAEIERVVLEYGVKKRTCGNVMAKAFPRFEPGKSVEVRWTWEMLKSGNEPPGVDIWYRWRATDRSGNEAESEMFEVNWLDKVHNWQEIRREKITLHWYEGPAEFAERLLASASDSMERLAATTGLAPQNDIGIYVYGSIADMRDATLYEPGWTGGRAYPAEDVVIMGISPDDEEWGRSIIAHELTHVLVGHLTFSCLSDVPTWLDEGIAMYGEGGLEKESEEALVAAIIEDRLISLRALSGGFSEHPDRANLSYSQSYSVVNYLIEEHGKVRLLGLFGELRRGVPVEEALEKVYGFGLEGLEDSWRASVRARERPAGEIAPTHSPEPTPVPTYRPISGAPVAPTAGPTRIPLPRRATGRSGNEGVDASTATALAVTIILVGLPALYLFIRRRRR